MGVFASVRSMLPRPRALLALLALAALPLAGCGSSGGAAETTTAATAASGASESAAGGVRLSRVKGGLGDALLVTAAPGQANRLYVVQQSGKVRILQNGRMLPTAVPRRIEPDHLRR